MTAPLTTREIVTKKSLLLHLLAFCWCCFGTYCDVNYYHSKSFDTYGGRFKYMTMITAYINLMAFGIAFLIDFYILAMGKNGYLGRRIIAVRDHLISTWVSNLSVFVVIIFWTIAAIDIEGIHPAEHQKLVPLFGWYNHYLHTIPALISTFLLINVNYTLTSLRSTTMLITLFSIIYSLWMIHLANVTGEYPYGFVDAMSRKQFVLFTFSCTLFICAIDRLNRRIVLSMCKEENVGGPKKDK